MEGMLLKINVIGFLLVMFNACINISGLLTWIVSVKIYINGELICKIMHKCKSIIVLKTKKCISKAIMVFSQRI